MIKANVISMAEHTSIYIVLSLLQSDEDTSAVELVGAFHTLKEAQEERERLMRLVAKVAFDDEGKCDAVPSDFAKNYVIKKIVNYEPVRAKVVVINGATPR